MSPDPLPDTVTLTKHAVRHGVGGVLMLPPSYFKGVSDEGLYRSYAEVIERVGDDRMRIYLYHFPQMSAVPLGVDLVRRLCEGFPGIVVGMKDSSGEQANLERMLTAFPGFAMFAGTEMLLLANMRFGGAGCIILLSLLTPEWPLAAVFALAGMIGVTVSGWNGISLAEIARSVTESED